jgi:nitroreductase
LREKFFEAMQNRHACKEFDSTKKISSEDLRDILEVGRLSPSSFGMEHWEFLVVQNSDLKAKIREVCWNQVQITSCSELVIVLAKKDDLKPNTPYVKELFSRRDYPQDKIDGYLKLYESYMQDKLESRNLFDWARAQCYIASANMMTFASFIGIDSCPIEGFERDKLEALLELNESEFQVALVLPFGFRLKEAQEKKRLSFERVVKFIK